MRPLAFVDLETTGATATPPIDPSFHFPMEDTFEKVSSVLDRLNRIKIQMLSNHVLVDKVLTGASEQLIQIQRDRTSNVVKYLFLLGQFEEPTVPFERLSDWVSSVRKIMTKMQQKNVNDWTATGADARQVREAIDTAMLITLENFGKDTKRRLLCYFLLQILVSFQSLIPV